MRTFIVFSVYLIILLISVILKLLHKNRRLCEKIQYVDEANMWHKLAITDDLTGVYNRTAYNKRVMELKGKAPGRSWGILLFDIDNFKAINDTKGHLEGDRVLQKVAKALSNVFPEPRYSIFRIGGDEFAVIAEDINERETIKLLLALRDCLEADGRIRLSKGYAIVRDNVERAFKDADEMLYADKASRK